MTKDNILKFLKSHKDEMKKKYAIKKIALFGSYARDEAGKKSDIDILVDMPSSYKNFYSLKNFLETNLKVKVDLGLEKNLREFVKKRVEKDLIYV